MADPEKMKTVYNGLRRDAPGRNFPANWEILLKVAVRDGVPLEASVVSFRAGTGNTVR
jgi:hypothetical protein